MPTLAEQKQKYLRELKISGSKVTLNAAQKAAIDKQGHLYKLGSNDSNNIISDKNGKAIKQNNVVKFTPSFLGSLPGNWQIFPSASAGRTEGDGEVVLVNDTNGWNVRIDFAKHKNLLSCSFMEFVSDGPT